MPFTQGHLLPMGRRANALPRLHWEVLPQPNSPQKQCCVKQYQASILLVKPSMIRVGSVDTTFNGHDCQAGLQRNLQDKTRVYLSQLKVLNLYH